MGEKKMGVAKKTLRYGERIEPIAYLAFLAIEHPWYI
jgi:hypothetical protein